MWLSVCRAGAVVVCQAPFAIFAVFGPLGCLESGCSQLPATACAGKSPPPPLVDVSSGSSTAEYLRDTRWPRRVNFGTYTGSQLRVHAYIACEVFVWGAAKHPRWVTPLLFSTLLFTALPLSSFPAVPLSRFLSSMNQWLLMQSRICTAAEDCGLRYGSVWHWLLRHRNSLARSLFFRSPRCPFVLTIVACANYACCFT